MLSLTAMVAVACSPGPTPASASPTVFESQQPVGTAASASPSPSVASESPPEVTPNPVGFAFAADDVLAYYAGVGYECTAPSPSTQAAGYEVRTCQRTDSAGRTLTVGLVTDPAGALGNAFASVKAVEGEAVLESVAAMDPLSGFLGAMLGSERGGDLVEWLAGHAGDAYAQTSEGGLKIATYTPSANDHTAIYVELASQAYMEAPRP